MKISSDSDLRDLSFVYERGGGREGAGEEGRARSIGLVLIGREGYNFPDGSERAHSSFSSS